MAKAVIYLPVEFRPGRGTFDVYSAQSTLEEAVGWYAKQKGLRTRPTDLEEQQGPEGTTWRFDVDRDGGFAVINRYAVPIVETED